MYNFNINDEASDLEHRQKITSNTSQAIKLRVKDFHSILVDPPKVSHFIIFSCYKRVSLTIKYRSSKNN